MDGTTYTGCWSKGRMQVDELWLSLKDAHTHGLKVAHMHNYIQVHAMLQKSFTDPIGAARYLLLVLVCQEKLEDLENMAENITESAICVLAVELMPHYQE